MRKLLDRFVRPFGLKVISARQPEMVYQHKYVGGYDEYRATQIKHNKRKLENVWADDVTLSAIAADIKAHDLGAKGVCHGARNGYEVEWFSKALGGEIIGTDISDTATKFPNMHVWNFSGCKP